MKRINKFKIKNIYYDFNNMCTLKTLKVKLIIITHIEVTNFYIVNKLKIIFDLTKIKSKAECGSIVRVTGGR